MDIDRHTTLYFDDGSQTRPMNDDAISKYLKNNNKNIVGTYIKENITTKDYEKYRGKLNDTK